MSRPNLTRATRAAIVSLGLVLGTAPLLPAQIYRVYGWETLPRGWVEPTLWTSYVADAEGLYEHFGRTLGRDDLWAHELEVEYGVTDRWTVAGYLDFEDPNGESFQYIAARITSRYSLFSRYERFFNTALYAEYIFVDPDYEDADEFEARLILEKDLYDFRLRLNPIFSKDVSGEEVADRAQIGFAGGLYYRRFYALQPGLELFANVNEVTDPEVGDEDSQYLLSPVLTLRFARGWQWTLGAAFGVTEFSDDVTIRSWISYEFPTVRPANQSR